jgi:N-methylhydantoinase A
LPEYREYERTSTICINAYVMPKVNSYVRHLEDALRELDAASELYIMQSNGGVISAQMARKSSARTVLSGPAGGVLIGVHLSQTLKTPNVITIDMGGTSSDICLIESAQPKMTTEADIEGYPIKLPMIDINTIGAGGASIAWIGAGGALRVGPQSAGADPGPVCYGRGGDKPTVTDANVILGRINPTYLLGGEMGIHLDTAKEMLAEKIAGPLGMDLMQAAEGIIAVVNANMIRGIRRAGRPGRTYSLASSADALGGQKHPETLSH